MIMNGGVGGIWHASWRIVSYYLSINLEARMTETSIPTVGFRSEIRIWALEYEATVHQYTGPFG